MQKLQQGKWPLPLYLCDLKDVVQQPINDGDGGDEEEEDTDAAKMRAINEELYTTDNPLDTQT